MNRQTAHPRSRRWVFPVALLALPVLLSSLPARAASTAPPAKEDLKYGETDLVIERTSRATAQDVQIPFYKGAVVQKSLTRRVSKKGGKQLSYYAEAVLETRDRPEVVAKTYSAQLPGKPKPERITDKQGTRWVLGVASKAEVRTVTIRKTAKGSSITLTRAVKHTETLTLPKAKVLPQPSLRGRQGPGPGRAPRRVPRGTQRA